MGKVKFTVTHAFSEPPSRIWAAMTDWEGHGEWIPATVVHVDPGDSVTVGATFSGRTGYGPLTLVDDMVISVVRWNPESGEGYCEVDKLGPVLGGRAGFTLTPTATGSQVVWFEDVTVSFLPGVLSPVVSRAAGLGFSLAMKALAKLLRENPDRYASSLVEL